MHDIQLFVPDSRPVQSTWPGLSAKGAMVWTVGELLKAVTMSVLIGLLTACMHLNSRLVSRLATNFTVKEIDCSMFLAVSSFAHASATLICKCSPFCARLWRLELQRSRRVSLRAQGSRSRGLVSQVF
jgi:hypothetical protein